MNPSVRPETRLLAIASVRFILLHLRQQNASSNYLAQYTTPTPAGATPSRRSRTPRERRNRVSKKSKRKLTDRQERRRIEGLRILARIIARHYLANPHLYRNGADGDGSQSARKEGEA